jgi:hypothetical protein
MNKSIKYNYMKSMKKISCVLTFLFFLTTASVEVLGTQKAYGYSLGKDTFCSVWWAEALYKIKPDDTVPEGKVKPVLLKAAVNEYESFQLVFTPAKNINNLTVSIDGLSDKSGNEIGGDCFTVRDEAYLYVDRPTDDYGKKGWYPDPLPELKRPVDLKAGKNHPLWITVKVPKGTTAGRYSGEIKLNADGWQKTIPLELTVWNFSLPDKPAIRSSFGLRIGLMKKYHNLKNDEQVKSVADKYYRAMREYSIAPTKPFELYPMKVTVDGLYWDGGIFTSDTVFAGKKSLKIVDNDKNSNVEAFTTKLIEVKPSGNYKLVYHARTLNDKQKYCILIKCYDREKKYMIYENRMVLKTGKRSWQQEVFDLRPFGKDIRYVSVHLFPAFRSMSGCDTGTAWFDDVALLEDGNENNLIPQGDFEVSPDQLTVSVDFSAFDEAGRKYIDEMGFNAFHLALDGMPSGNYHKQRKGLFHGFYQGTPEYDVMMKKYLTLVQQHLKEKGWLGKEYVYWFDEPQKSNYPFVREGMEILRRSAPEITTFITEDNPGSAIMDVTDISCTNIGKIDKHVVDKWPDREFWSYLCCCPTAPYLTLFIDHDAINMRMWLWLSYKFKLKGILVWTTNYWTSENALPKGYFQNPWKNPMSYTSGSYGNPWGMQETWGNGDGRLFYPPNAVPDENGEPVMEGPVPSVRLEIMRDGIEDYEYLVMLKKIVSEDNGRHKRLIREAAALLDIPDSLVKDQKEYNKDPKSIIEYRNRIGELLDAFFND